MPPVQKHRRLRVDISIPTAAGVTASLPTSAACRHVRRKPFGKGRLQSFCQRSSHRTLSRLWPAMPFGMSAAPRFLQQQEAVATLTCILRGAFPASVASGPAAYHGQHSNAPQPPSQTHGPVRPTLPHPGFAENPGRAYEGGSVPPWDRGGQRAAGSDGAVGIAGVGEGLPGIVWGEQVGPEAARGVDELGNPRTRIGLPVATNGRLKRSL